jgi:hypothetical protein
MHVIIVQVVFYDFLVKLFFPLFLNVLKFQLHFNKFIYVAFDLNRSSYYARSLWHFYVLFILVVELGPPGVLLGI